MFTQLDQGMVQIHIEKRSELGGKRGPIVPKPTFTYMAGADGLETALPGRSQERTSAARTLRVAGRPPAEGERVDEDRALRREPPDPRLDDEGIDDLVRELGIVREQRQRERRAGAREQAALGVEATEERAAIGGAVRTFASKSVG